MSLYPLQILCYILMPLSLIVNQGHLIPVLILMAVLIRRQMILEQQVVHLMGKDLIRNTAQHWREQGLKQVAQVKGV